MSLEDKSLYFVTGKGGVGKSTLSLILANHFAARGFRVLLVELNPQSSAFHLGQLSQQPKFNARTTKYGFDVALLGGPDCLENYVGYFVKVQKLTHLFFNNRLMRAVVPLAPGLDDLAILGKLTSHIRGHGPPLEYDKIVIDAPSTGSFLSMLRAPSVLAETVRVGPLNYHSKKIFEILKSPEYCHYFFVTLLERFPMDELLESTNEFSKAMSCPFSVVANQVIPDVQTDGLGEKFKNFLLDKYQDQEKYLDIIRSKFLNYYQQSLLSLELPEVLKKGELFPTFISG